MCTCAEWTAVNTTRAVDKGLLEGSLAINDAMSSLVEIKNHNEIYIHYIGQDTINEKNLVRVMHITKCEDEEVKSSDSIDDISDKDSSMVSVSEESVEIAMNSLSLLSKEMGVVTCEIATQVDEVTLRSVEKGKQEWCL